MGPLGSSSSQHRRGYFFHIPCNISAPVALSASEETLNSPVNLKHVRQLSWDRAGKVRSGRVERVCEDAEFAVRSPSSVSVGFGLPDLMRRGSFRSQLDAFPPQTQSHKGEASRRRPLSRAQGRQANEVNFAGAPVALSAWVKTLNSPL